MGRKRTVERLKDNDLPEDFQFEEAEPAVSGQRLYVLGFDRYVQHDGSKVLPRELKEYLATKNGEYPPFMPLPKGPVTFRLGGEFGSGRRVRWDGEEKLPEQVLRYVKENGTLPRYSEEE